nr:MULTISPECIES: tail fiber protein [Pseudomonas]
MVNGKFVDENPVNGTPGSLIPAEWGNAVTTEILGVIQQAGLTPNEVDNGQLANAILTIVTNNTPGSATEITAGILKLSTGTQVIAGTDDATAVTPKKLLQKLVAYIAQATEAAPGWAKVATQALTNAGVDDVTIVTPKKLAVATQSQILTAFTTAGNAPSFTLTPSPAVTAYVANQRFRVKFSAAGVGNDTLNISGLGAKTLKQYDSSGNKIAVVLAAGQLADVEYDGTDIVVLDPLPLSTLPAGTIISSATSAAPSGYLIANGAAISRTTYAALFSAIGTVFGGGDGSTTFNLPDLRGEFVRGWDAGRGVDVGRTFGSFQIDAFSSHTHAQDSRTILGVVGAAAQVGGSNGINGGTTSATGGVETRPRNLALLYCIKY